MKVGLLSQWFAPEPGGAAIPTVLADRLARRGHDVTVLTGFPNYPTGRVQEGYRQGLRHVETLPSGVRVRRVPLYPSHDGGAIGRSLNYLSFGSSARVLGISALADLDALWVYNSPATVPPAALRAKHRYGVPYLLHVMDVWPDSVTSSGMLGSSTPSRMAEALLTRLVRRGYAGASVIAVTSPGQIDLLASRGVARHALQYCPVWADESVFYPREPDRTLLPPEARDAHRVAMYAGALGHIQGLDAVVRAARATRDEGLHLVIVGSGIAEPQLRELAVDIGADNVHFLGRRPAETMGALASAADIQVVSLADTPLTRITMPSKLPAVMALGRPVLMCGAGDAAQVVSESGAGVVARSEDFGGVTEALRQLVVAPQHELNTMSQRGLDYYLREFSETRGLAHVEAMLHAIAG